MIKVKDIVGILQTSFRANNIPKPQASSYHVIGKSINLSQRILRRNSFLPLSLYHYNKIQKFALRRLKHEPIEYILAHRQFRGLSLKMERPVMIPNPVTEQLVDIALDLFKNHEGRLHFVDVGCGSGAISLSLLKEKPGSYGVAIDTSLPALELTVKNFKRIFGKEVDMGEKLDVIQSSFKEFADKNVHKFNLIISSPPYMPSEDLTKLGKQIKKYGDLKALDGGQYGLDVVWELIRNASSELKNGGFLVIETNPGQPEYLEDYFRNHGNLVHHLTFYGTREDSQFRKRFVILQKKVSMQGKDQSSAESD